MATDDGRTHWATCWREHRDCAARRVEELENSVIALAARLAALTAVVEAARAYQRAEMRYQTQQRNGIRSGAVADERHDADVALDQALAALDATAAGPGVGEGEG